MFVIAVFSQHWKPRPRTSSSTSRRHSSADSQDSGPLSLLKEKGFLPHEGTAALSSSSLSVGVRDAAEGLDHVGGEANHLMIRPSYDIEEQQLQQQQQPCFFQAVTFSGETEARASLAFAERLRGNYVAG